MIKIRKASLLLLAAGTVLRLNVLSASAATLYWDPLKAGGASWAAGAWDASTPIWANAATGGTDATWIDGRDAVFGGTASGTAGVTVTLGTPISVGNLTISTAAVPVSLVSTPYTIATAAGDALTVSGGINASYAAGTSNITGAGGLILVGDQTINVGPAAITGSGAGMNISTVISGSGVITKTGSGTLALSGANAFTGKFAVTNGLLAINSDSALGATPSTFVADDITLNGGGLTVGVTFKTAVNFSDAGNMALGANRGITLGASGGTIRTGFNDILTVNGVVSGAGALTKTDSGTLVLAADNTYQGATSITGILQLGTGGTTGSINSATITFTSATSALNINRSDDVTLSNNMVDGNRANIGVTSGRTVTLTGVISGAGGLTTTGAGTLVLATNNTYQGTTSITGILQLGTGGTTGSINTAAITFGSGGNNFLNVKRSDDVPLANNIATGGRANISSTGGEKITLTGAITGTGELWIHGTGTVVVNANAASSRASNNVIESGFLEVSDLTRTANSTLGTGNIFLGQSSTPTTGAGLRYTGTSVSTDAIQNIQTPYGFLDVTQSSTVLTTTNTIKGSDGTDIITKLGAGTWDVSGGTDNTRLTIQLNAGTVLLDKASTSGFHAVSGLIVNAGLVQLAGTGDDQIYDGSTVQVNGGTFDMNGHNEAFSILNSTGGNNGLITNNLAGSPSTLTVSSNNTTSLYTGKLQDGAGQMALTKAGSGSLTLTGNSVITGGVNLTSGRLIVSGSLTGSIANISGGVLGGTGTVGYVLVIGGTVSPGANATGAALGTLHTGTLDLSGGGVYEAAISTSTLASSLASIKGDLNVGFSGSLLMVTDVGVDTGDPVGAKFTLMSYSGAWDGGLFNFGGLGFIDDGGQFTVGSNTFKLDYDAASSTIGNHDVVLTVMASVVPEPASSGLLLGGLVVLGSRRRRRKAGRAVSDLMKK